MTGELKPELKQFDLGIFEPNPHPGQANTVGLKLFAEMFGDPQKLYELGIVRESLTEAFTDDKVSAKANRWFLGNYRGNYGLPSIAYAQRFFLDQQDTAFRVIERYKAAVPALRNVLGVKNELRSDQPTDYLEWFTSPDVSPRLGFEAQRALALSAIAGASDVRDLRVPFEAEGGRIQKHIDSEGVFEGQIGAGEQKYFDATFDNKTNVVVREGARDSHQKRLLAEVRQVEGVGNVFTILRKKEPDVAAIKSVWKAELANRKGDQALIKPWEVVNDHFGMLFMTLDDNANVDLLMERVLGAMLSYKRQPGEITPDFQNNGDQGQSNSLRFDGRFQVYLRGLNGSPFELMFFSKNNYLNSQFEVGSVDPQTKLYNGQAHELYELQRMAIVAPILFPSEYYRITKAFEFASFNKAKELRSRNNAESGRKTHFTGEALMRLMAATV